MKRFIYKIWARFLTQFGNIRISKYPPFLYYDTVDYKINGDNILEIMSVLKPGDCLCRGYDSYLDSKFIPDEFGYSHGAIYVGNNKIIHAVAEGVSEINVVDFCQCDRIAIFRPRAYQKSAIKNAMKYIGTEYDFVFTYGDSSIYCFELCALCYPKLDIRRIELKRLFGLIKKNVYLAKSMFQSKDMKCVYQFNPKFNIDYCSSEER